MSSLLRRIQRKRRGLGSRLGVPANPKSADLLARLAREDKRKEKK